jgi:hypothetical protein
VAVRAEGADRDALAELATRMSVVLADAEGVRRMIALRRRNGFEFDD